MFLLYRARLLDFGLLNNIIIRVYVGKFGEDVDLKHQSEGAD